MKEKIKTYIINDGDSDYVFESFESANYHLMETLKDFGERTKSLDNPEVNDGSDELCISIEVCFKYTREEIDNLPER